MVGSPKKFKRRLIKEQTRRPGRRTNAENLRRKEEARERATHGLELRKAGATWQEIANALGYSDQSSAKRAVDRLMNGIKLDAAKDVVALDLQRLDEYQMRCTQALRQTGDLNQIDRLLRIMEARYRLLGIGDDTVRELREMYGVSSAVPISNSTTNVMVVQSSETTEVDFIKKMMQAVGQDPESPEAQAYIAERVERKAIEHKPKKKSKKKVVRSKKKTTTDVPNYRPLEEEEVVDAEIVDENEEAKRRVRELLHQNASQNPSPEKPL